MKMRVVLASASPRRRELLRQIGMEFEVRVSDVDESLEGWENAGPLSCVRELSRRKAQKVYEELEAEPGGEEAGEEAGEEKGALLVIGSDTLVAKGSMILGKPRDRADAIGMLKALEGEEHEVHTGVTCICREPGGSVRYRTFVETAKVWFYPMSGDEIEAYVDSGEPMDKAGAYGIQGLCARYIRGIRGDYNTVVGLPVGRLYQEIKTLCPAP